MKKVQVATCCGSVFSVKCSHFVMCVVFSLLLARSVNASPILSTARPSVAEEAREPSVRQFHPPRKNPADEREVEFQLSDFVGSIPVGMLATGAALDTVLRFSVSDLAVRLTAGNPTIEL